MNAEQRAALRKVAEEAVSRNSTSIPYMSATNPSTILQLLDYIETLEKDASRYRWLRSGLSDPKGVSHHFCSIQRGAPEELDAAIDAAIGETE